MSRVLFRSSCTLAAAGSQGKRGVYQRKGFRNTTTTTTTSARDWHRGEQFGIGGRRSSGDGRKRLVIRNAATAVPSQFSKITPCGGRTLIQSPAEDDANTMSMGGVLLPGSR